MKELHKLLTKEIDEMKRYEFSDYLLELLSYKIRCVLQLKNDKYFSKLKDLVDNRDMFTKTAQVLLPIPDLGSSSEYEKFIDFLISVIKAIKTDKENAVKEEKLRRLEELRSELKKLEREVYGNDSTE